MAVWLLVWGKSEIKNLDEVAKFLTKTPIDIPVDLEFLSETEIVDSTSEKVLLDCHYRHEL
jgi:hypothetical protein